MEAPGIVPGASIVALGGAVDRACGQNDGAERYCAETTYVPSSVTEAAR